MPRSIKNIGYLLYRCWFYVWVAIPIILFFPFLLATTLSKKTFRQFYWLARNIWAKPILYAMGCLPQLLPDDSKPLISKYMLISNHSSMLDIMLMLYVSKNPFVFVGKAELARLPLFGFFYKRVCILVNRSDAKSRKAVYHQVNQRLLQGLGICIFPEGGVPNEDVVLGDFKDGAFHMAINHNLSIMPMVFLDCKKRFSWTFFSGGPGPLRVRFLKSIDTTNMDIKQRNSLKTEVRNQMLKILESEQ